MRTRSANMPINPPNNNENTTSVPSAASNCCNILKHLNDTIRPLHKLLHPIREGGVYFIN